MLNLKRMGSKLHRGKAKVFKIAGLSVALSLLVATVSFASQSSSFELKSKALSDSYSIEVGNVRVQVISPRLVRLEVKGPEGYEDRTTYYVQNRSWPGTSYTTSSDGSYQLIKTSNYIVKVPLNATSLTGCAITQTDGTNLWTYTSLPTERAILPSASSTPLAWGIADNPRMVPSSWGYSIPNAANASAANNGWDLSNNAPDMYVFLPGGDAKQLRKDFVDLTGHTDMVPLSALGFWDSRYYEYTEATALQQIADYRSHDIPLDNLVIDTNWRNNGSTGYDVNTSDFPDIQRFFTEAHNANVKVMFNDHPEPVNSNALSSAEVAFRNNGLLGLLTKGLDTWWFDRNWSVALSPPAGTNKETWGMYLYHWITAAANSAKRPMIMANVDGIDSGYLHNAASIASHRYDIQWTGDISPDFTSMQREVYNAVFDGTYSAFAYTSCDLGGHVADPTTEGYIRWLEYGTFSPITRVHCTMGYERMPWTFGTTAETVARDFVKMRYRLLPVYYSLARENYDDGTPILRRCDEDYPQYKEAQADDQYMLGDNILVAPITTGATQTAVPTAWLTTADGQPGLTAQYYNNSDLSGDPVLTRVDSKVDFNWGTDSPDSSVNSDNFSVKWSGNINVGDQDAQLMLKVDDGARLYIDGKTVIDSWTGHDSSILTANVTLDKNTTHTIALEYYEGSGNAVCSLEWMPSEMSSQQRTVWIPEGAWKDVWTGTVYTGPKTVTVSAPIDEMPIFVKSGTILPLAPDMSYTGEKAWDPITLDVYPSVAGAASNRLYEDDTTSNDYKTGSYRTTQLHTAADNSAKTVTVTVDAAKGTYSGAAGSRSWTVRLHQTAEWMNATPVSATVDGKAATFTTENAASDAMPFADAGGARDGRVVEVTVPSGPVTSQRVITVTYSNTGAAVDKTTLVSQINAAAAKISADSAKDASAYTALSNALSAAQTVDSDAAASQSQVDAAAASLTAALKNFVPVAKLTVDEFRGDVDLSAEGTLSWAQFGRNGNVSDYDCKAGSSLISKLSTIGSSSYGTVTDSQIHMYWSDGTTAPSASDVISTVAQSSDGNGSSFTVHVTQPSRLKVYTTSWSGTGKLQVTSSDGASTLTETYASPNAANGYAAWTLDLLPYDGFKESDYTISFITVGSDNYHNTSIQGATLSVLPLDADNGQPSDGSGDGNSSSSEVENSAGGQTGGSSAGGQTGSPSKGGQTNSPSAGGQTNSPSPSKTAGTRVSSTQIPDTGDSTQLLWIVLTGCAVAAAAVFTGCMRKRRKAAGR